MVLSPCSSHLTFLALIHQRILISAYYSSQWSTWCRDVESRIQQLACTLDDIIGEYSRFKENTLTSLKTLVFCEWKSDIFWQVPHHHRWRVGGALAKKDSTVLSQFNRREFFQGIRKIGCVRNLSSSDSVYTKNRRSLSTESLWTIIIRNLATHFFTADCQVEEQEKLSSESAHPQKLETILLPAFQQLSQKILMVLTINNATSKSVFTVS